jgi:hypothetical protein
MREPSCPEKPKGRLAKRRCEEGASTFTGPEFLQGAERVFVATAFGNFKG